MNCFDHLYTYCIENGSLKKRSDWSKQKMPKLRKTGKENQEYRRGLNSRILIKKKPTEVVHIIKQMNLEQFADLLFASGQA